MNLKKGYIMKKSLIVVGLACFVLGILVGCFFSPDRYKLYFKPSPGFVCFKIDTVTGKVWEYNVDYCYFERCLTSNDIKMPRKQFQEQ
jgi:hypothetical protein